MLTDEEYQLKQLELDKKIIDLEQEKCELHNKLKRLKQEKEELRIDHSLNRLKNRPDASKWTSRKYAWSRQVKSILKHTFKFEKFRSNQLAAINATLYRKDVILVMPTGGGKSLVYQIPSLVTGGLSVVISPLISLIEDQLMSLKRLGISAATVNSSSVGDDKKDVMAKMLSGELKLIFVTPEWRAKTKIFMKHLTTLYRDDKLARFIIDEVHCCSQWGHDFRPDYLTLSVLKGQFPRVPILGLTATATSNVLVDIQNILEIPDSEVITAPYNRPNLFYEVIRKPEGKPEAFDYLELLFKDKYRGKTGIIYAGTQRECEDLATVLKSRDIKAAPYHANLDSHKKSKIHKKWAANAYQVIIATIAFGMGIDKPDVRFVIHYTVPKSLEGLYQESGRAGRDGEKADCVLMFSLADWVKMLAMAQNSKQEKSLFSVLNYCLNISKCRREMISEYFDDDWRSTDCQEMCDRCINSSKVAQTYDISSCLTDILQVINIATVREINLTLKKLLDSWFLAGPKSLTADSKPKFTREEAEYMIAFLISKDFLMVRKGYNLVTTLPYIDTSLEQALDRKKFEGPIAMQYIGIIKGVPLLTGRPDCKTLAATPSRPRPGCETLVATPSISKKPIAATSVTPTYTKTTVQHVKLEEGTVDLTKSESEGSLVTASSPSKTTSCCSSASMDDIHAAKKRKKEG